jgi:hypothetical protein
MKRYLKYGIFLLLGMTSSYNVFAENLLGVEISPENWKKIGLYLEQLELTSLHSPEVQELLLRTGEIIQKTKQKQYDDLVVMARAAKTREEMSALMTQRHRVSNSTEPRVYAIQGTFRDQTYEPKFTSDEFWLTAFTTTLLENLKSSKVFVTNREVWGGNQYSLAKEQIEFATRSLIFGSLTLKKNFEDFSSLLPTQLAHTFDQQKISEKLERAPFIVPLLLSGTPEQTELRHPRMPALNSIPFSTTSYLEGLKHLIETIYDTSPIEEVNNLWNEFYRARGGLNQVFRTGYTSQDVKNVAQACMKSEGLDKSRGLFNLLTLCVGQAKQSREIKAKVLDIYESKTENTFPINTPIDVIHTINSYL